MIHSLLTLALSIAVASGASKPEATPDETWTMDGWCRRPEHIHAAAVAPRVAALPASSREFLQLMDLSTVHPHCADSTIRHRYEVDGVPPQGPLTSHDHLDTIGDVVVTVFMRTAPSLLAMMELWLRLLAYVVAPLGVAYLLATYYDYCYYQAPLPTLPPASSTSNGSNGKARAHKRKREDHESAAAAPAPATTSATTTTGLIAVVALTVASSLVLCTDNLYVLEHGPVYGISWLLLSTAASYLISRELPRDARQRIRLVLVTMAALGLVLTVDYEPQRNRFVVSWGDAAEACRVPEGLYYDATHGRARKLVENWSSQSSYQYSVNPIDDGSTSSSSSSNVSTPWMPTGDARTGLPFLLHSIADPPQYLRLWLPVPDTNHGSSRLPLSDEEVVALDVSFPASGFDGARPTYLVLHGLSGGSQEEYIKDLVLRRNAEGSTVLVMIARGLMDLPVRGWNLFHGARTTDVREAANVVRTALDGWHDREQLQQNSSTAPSMRPTLVGVGYSMGGIVLANYVARAGSACPLDVAVSVSGGLDLRYQANFTRAQRLWQPILTQELRNTFLVGKWGDRVRRRLTADEMKQMQRAYHITDIDKMAVVVYNQFRDLDHYYSEMSALGDTPLDLHEQYNNSAPSNQLVKGMMRLQTLSIPLLVVHALDDPLISWRTVAANQGLMHPDQLTRWVPNGNLFVLLTKRGGHIGWPLGLNPTQHKWKWMSDVVMTFAQAFVTTESLNNHHEMSVPSD